LFPTWLDIVSSNKILGKRTHDARIAALMKTSAISHILTLNPDDFANIPGVTVVQPQTLIDAG
jgi:predicted nucleic acid-binding protein